MIAANGPIDARLEAYRAMFRLDGKTALVLGAASGIGKASAEVLAALGATVICADKNKEGVETTAADIGLLGPTEAHVVDANSGQSVDALAAAIETNHKRLDIAVTTPAIHVRKLMCDYTDDEYNRVADLNLRGTFFFLRAFGRMMVRQRGGSLIASSSVRATTLEPGIGHLRRDQSRNHPNGARPCFRNWSLWGTGQCRCSEHRGDPTCRSAQGQDGDLECFGVTHCIQSVGSSERGGGGSRFSRLGCRELCNGHRAPGRWRLDGDRWTTHGTNNDASEERDYAVIATRQSRRRSFE